MVGPQPELRPGAGRRRLNPAAKPKVHSHFEVPYVRWADSVTAGPGGCCAANRQLYDHELVYVLEGQARIVLDGRSHAVGADALFLVQPRIWHSFFAAETSGVRLLGVHFDWHERWDTAAFARFSPAVSPVKEDQFRTAVEIERWSLQTRPWLDLRGRGRVRRTLEAVCAEQGRADAESGGIAGALLAAALGQIAREARFLDELDAHATVGPDTVRRVQRARDFLEAPRNFAVSVDEAAARVGWSGDHLRRTFRQVLGTSPASVQTAARVRRAQELLRYKSLSVAEVARRCGFGDASHFARVFRRTTGHAPRDWLFLMQGRPDEN